MELRAGYSQTEIRNIPDDWIIKPLSELAQFLDGKRRPVKDIDRAKMRGEIPYYGASGIVDYVNDFIFNEELILIGEDGENIISRNLRLAFRISGKAWVNNHAHVIKPNSNVSIGFLCDYLESINYEQYNSGTAQPKLNKQTCANIPIAIPINKTEQDLIADALSDADALIESLEKLIDKKRQIKQGLMQEILTGKKRLAGFSGEWVEKKLRDLGECYRGVSYDPSVDLSESDTNTSYRLLRSNNVQGGKIVFSDMQYVDSKRVSSLQKLKINDVLICMANGSKDLVGKSARFFQDDGYIYTFGAFMGCFRCNPDAVPGYVFNLFYTKQFLNHIGILLAGSSINNLTPSSIENFEILVPSEIEEQRAIAGILSDMDSELTELNSKLAKARQIKEGMMQELLTGRIRLV